MKLRGYILLALTSVMGFETFAGCALQKTDIGEIHRSKIYSPQLADSIDIDVWLPMQYNPGAKFPVLYMHDGQNLYDPTTTWNKQAWEMDSVAGNLINDQKLPPFIIVGIHSDPQKRVSQLMPEKAVTGEPLQLIMEEVGLTGEKCMGDEYAEFVVKTLKPYIDSNYSTLSSAENTFVMGSSMGGLMSLYLLCEYPETFGGAGCLSTHWYGASPDDLSFGSAMLKYVASHLPLPNTHKLYLDHGTATIDKYYGPWNEGVLAIARLKGYVDGQSISSFVDEGATHSENSWKERVEIPLLFLMKR